MLLRIMSALIRLMAVRTCARGVPRSHADRVPDLFLTMIANEWQPRRQISCCLLGDGDPSKPENYLLLLPLVERAYVAHEACILPDSDGRLKFHVLNPALLPLTLHPSQKTFAALDGGHLHHPVDRSPNRDMLIQHATVALDMAVKRGFLSKSAADALRSGSL